MRLNELQYQNVRPVSGYGPGFFRIGEEVMQGAVLLMGDDAVSWAGLQAPEPLVALAGRVDVLLIGTGSEIAHLPPTLRAALDACQIPYEIMASAPAARTYNVLLSEGRRIAAALVPVE